MATFELQLPDSIISDMERLYGNAEKIMGEMTKAGAEVAYKNTLSNLPASLRNSNFKNNVKISRTYKMPSVDAIATQVEITGYFTNKDGKKTPAPLVANVFEHGRSSAPFPKQPFFRKSFKKAEIEKAMLDAQIKASGGLLTNE